MKKNVVILVTIYFFTLLFVFYSVALYKKSSDLIANESSINKFVKEISEKDYDAMYSNINNYIAENHSFLLYVNSSYSESLDYTNNLKEFIVENNMKNDFIYINMTSIKDYDIVNKLIDDFSDVDFVNVSKDDIPLFIYFQNGKIVDIIINSDLDLNILKNRLMELEVM